MAGAASDRGFGNSMKKCSILDLAVLLFAAIALATCAMTSPLAASETEFTPAFPSAPVLGPAAAKGAVIWSHGKGFAQDDAKSPNPIFLASVRDDGWDVYRLNRVDEIQEYRDPRANVTRDSYAKAEALLERVKMLKSLGYRRIALAGQSYGAWLSIMAAGRSRDVYAVIANSPAAYGDVKQGTGAYVRNAAFLYDFIGGMSTSRVMISYFRDDLFAPERRGPKSEEILARNNVAHLVIDDPDGPTGHGGGSSQLFETRFGACVLAVLDAPQTPTLASCENKSPKAPSANLPLPANHEPPPAPSGGPSDAFLGTWWGFYSAGREILLAVERVEGEKIVAVYTFGPAGSSPAGMREQHGQIEDGVLVFADQDTPRLEYRLDGDGSLEAKWINGGTTLVGRMRHLSP
jgi:pimeloyl-ACP methyl ester carboxylesterase